MTASCRGFGETPSGTGERVDIVDASGSQLVILAERALAEVRDGSLVGLGSGRAATAFVRVLAGRVARGLRVTGVPTSEATARLAASLGIPLTTLGEAGTLDVAIDGADEVAPNLDLIKGLGGALVREKAVASAAKRFVVLVTNEKLVQALGEHGTLPVEVREAELSVVRRILDREGLNPHPRLEDRRLYVSDNGNPIVDLRLEAPISDPPGLEAILEAIPGVVGTGLFLGMTDLVLVEGGGTVRELHRGGSRD